MRRFGPTWNGPALRPVLLVLISITSACAPIAPTPAGRLSPSASTVAAAATVEPTPTPRLLFPPLTPAPNATAVPIPGTASVLRDEVVQTGLAVPWDIGFAPDGRMFVTERDAGRVQIFASGATGAPRLGTLVVDNLARNSGSEEEGLLGLAFDPQFSANGFVYVCASRTDAELGSARNQVLRYKLSGETWNFDGYVIRQGIPVRFLHDGCRIRFDEAGHLWVTMGENGLGDPAQDPSSMLGKILRINPDGSIPADNPLLPGASERTAVYSMGHRNPQGIAIRGAEVYVIEHGPDVDDEINYIVAGGNYGWPLLRDFGGPSQGMIDPIWTSGNSTIAPSGGAFVNGSQWGNWSGSLFVVTLKAQSLRRFTVTPTRATMEETLLVGKYGRLRGATQGPDGALYISTSNLDGRGSNVQKPGDDKIIRVAPAMP